MADIVITCEHLSKHYPAPDGRTTIEVLKNISFSVQKGESIAILGPSGSGKSTLLHIIGLLDYPASGRVLIHEEDVTRLPEKDRDTIRNQVIGFVFQLHFLLPQCTVLENVLVPTLPGRKKRLPGGKTRSSREIENRALRLLSRAGLDSRRHHRPWQLSGGELQRVAFVRALINSPEILLADEPTGALDHRTSESLENLLIEVNKEEEVTLIVVTHDTGLAKKMDQMYILEDGIVKPA
jgi:lipoprotein-releasing system ATP-binding protein